MVKDTEAGLRYRLIKVSEALELLLNQNWNGEAMNTLHGRDTLTKYGEFSGKEPKS